MPRFFIEECLTADQQEIKLSGGDAHHISRVLRMRPGDFVIVCDGAGMDYNTVIDRITEAEICLRIKSRSENRTEPLWQARLFQGLPKGDKMDLIVQKAVELGVSEIVPVACDRSIAKLEGGSVERKLTRWNKIALEASGQSGRGVVPTICQPLSFARAVEIMRGSDASFIPWENERSVSLKRHLNERLPHLSVNTNEISFLIGPEGGFSQTEIDVAVKAGITPVTLGPRILRTETAGLAVLAMLGYQYEQF